MNEAKHTPGPWRLEVDGWRGQYLYGNDPQAGREIYIAELTLYWNSAPHNARLIASAPELLEALLDFMRDGGVYDTAVAKALFPSQAALFMEAGDKARAAIAKATGKESS